MDFKKLAKSLIAIAEAAAPVVGLAEEVEAGKNLFTVIERAFTDTKDAFDSEDQEALQTSLDALAARVNAHADKTIESLA